MRDCDLWVVRRVEGAGSEIDEGSRQPAGNVG